MALMMWFVDDDTGNINEIVDSTSLQTQQNSDARSIKQGTHVLHTDNHVPVDVILPGSMVLIFKSTIPH